MIFQNFQKKILFLVGFGCGTDITASRQLYVGGLLLVHTAFQRDRPGPQDSARQASPVASDGASPAMTIVAYVLQIAGHPMRAWCCRSRGGPTRKDQDTGRTGTGPKSGVLRWAPGQVRIGQEFGAIQETRRRRPYGVTSPPVVCLQRGQRQVSLPGSPYPPWPSKALRFSLSPFHSRPRTASRLPGRNCE